MQPLPEGTTAATLQAALSVFGEVLSAVVNNGNPNYGHVRFADPLSAQLAARQAVIQIGAKKVRPPPSTCTQTHVDCSSGHVSTVNH